MGIVFKWPALAIPGMTMDDTDIFWGAQKIPQSKRWETEGLMTGSEPLG